MRSRRVRQTVAMAAALAASLGAGVVMPARAAGTTPPGATPQASHSTAEAGTSLEATVDEYCVACHNARTATGRTTGVMFDTMDLAAVAKDPDVWERVVRKLRTRAMPPAGVRRPDDATYETVAAALEATLDRAAADAPHPGRPMFHRLNRAEYANAVRDLLGVEVDAASLLPPDDAADGFDTNAALLGVSPLLLERYLSAAAKISALAVGDATIAAASETFRISGDTSQSQHVEGLPLGTRGGLQVRHTFPLDGDYVLDVQLAHTSLGSIRGLEYAHDVEFLIDGQRVHEATVGGAADFEASASPETASGLETSIIERLRVRLPVKAGPREVQATFVEKSAATGGDRVQPYLRSTVMAGTDHTGLPHIDRLTITGPFDATGPGDTPSRRRIFSCHPASTDDEAACAEAIVSGLARRAYRRPPTPTEVDRLLDFYSVGRGEGGFERGIERALRGILASPKFVFRAEEADPSGMAPGTAYPVSDRDLASRLSFFLWSSIPDDELLTAAEAGRLGTSAELADQVRRMLADPRSEALVTNFAGQWLQLRNLRGSTPDRYAFPNFDANLRAAMQREVELFFGSIIHEDRNVLDLLTARDTFVNERLARHYGIPYVYGSQFRRVTLADESRRGLLGKAGILTLTSHPDRTSPVVRGKWILDNLLGSPPPPPPPNVPALEDSDGPEPRTMRERMERHRSNPVCASCHKIMDPIGLSLENFDAVGRWRTEEAGRQIDAAGELVDGTRVDGVATLREALLARPEVFVQTMTEKLMTYALGRGLEPYDMPAVRKIVAGARRQDYRFSSLILGVVNSVPFRMRLSREEADRRVAAR